MIFVTVGTQLPFDRLVKTVEKWALESQTHDVFAQTGASNYQPSAISSSRFLGVDEFDERVAACLLYTSPSPRDRG